MRVGEKIVKKMIEDVSLPLVESFYSLQGEGFHAGIPAYFIRLAGCRNACPFCDTPASWDEAGYPRVSISEILSRVIVSGAENCVVTGGEPLIHELNALCERLQGAGIACWLETSGSETLSGKWDWICLSPKKGIVVESGVYAAADELKVVVCGQDDFLFAEQQADRVGRDCLLYLQSEWGERSGMMREIVSYILEHPRWRLSLQTHKLIGIE